MQYNNCSERPKSLRKILNANRAVYIIYYLCYKYYNVYAYNIMTGVRRVQRRTRAHIRGDSFRRFRNIILCMYPETRGRIYFFFNIKLAREVVLIRVCIGVLYSLRSPPLFSSHRENTINIDCARKYYTRPFDGRRNRFVFRVLSCSNLYRRRRHPLPDLTDDGRHNV